MKTYTASKLNEWNQCQLKYYGHYLERQFWESETSLENILGRLIHTFFKNFYAKSETTLQFKKGLITLDAWKESFADKWQEESSVIEIATAKDIAIKLDKGLLCLENFYKREQKRDFKLPLFTEKDFSVNIDNLFKVKGSVDRIDEELDGTITITDYKITDYIKTAQQAQSDPQLAVYTYGCEQDILQRKVNKVGWFYPTRELDIFNDPARETQSEILSALLEMDTAIEQRGLNKNLYKHSPSTGFCDFCGYRSKCPEYTHEYWEEKESSNTDQMKEMVKAAYQLNEQKKEVEIKLTELKDKIKAFMIENNLMNLDNANLQRQERGNFAPVGIWQILKELDNGHDFIDIKKLALKENLECFSLEEQKIINNAYTPKTVYSLILKKPK